MTNDQIIERLKKLRKEQGWNQKKLAGLMGIGKASLSLYETGKRSPDLEIIQKWCTELGQIVLITDKP